MAGNAQKLSLVVIAAALEGTLVWHNWLGTCVFCGGCIGYSWHSYVEKQQALAAAAAEAEGGGAKDGGDDERAPLVGASSFAKFVGGKEEEEQGAPAESSKSS